jgi:tetratricopeptide (TPR) repeat protein
MTEPPIPEVPQKTVTRWNYWLPRLATAIFVPLLLLALTEGALRLFNIGYSTELMNDCTVGGQPSSCYNLFFAAPFFPPGMIKAPQFYTIPKVKTPDTYRIFVLGESAAMGDPDPAYGFSRYLEVMLRERFPDTKFEVINTGVVAIDSHVILPIARELAHYQPDLFIIYAGNNEVVGPYGPGTALTGSSLSLPAIRTSIFVRSTRIGQLLTKVNQPRSDWKGMEMFLDKQVRADSPALQRTYANFASNLRDIVGAARGSGARVLLITVATNLKDCPPFASMHRDGLTVEALRGWSSLMQQGTALENARSFADALKSYTAAAQIDDRYAELQFRIARCLWALGDYASAKEHFVRAQDLDTLRFRADTKINDIIRSVANSSGKQVELLDGQSVLASESPYGVIGSELLYEHVHLNPEGNYLLARTAFTHIVGDLPAAARAFAHSLNPLSDSECEQLLALTSHDRSRIASEMIQRMQRPPFTNQLNHAEQVQNLMFKANGSTETFPDTLSEYQWAIARAPSDRILHSKLGFVLFDFDRNAAAQQFILARPSDDFPVFLPDGTRIR